MIFLPRILPKIILHCIYCLSLGLLGCVPAHANPPAAAVLTAPAGVSSTATPVYEWEAVPGATWYYLWVNDSTGTPIKQWFNNSVCDGEHCSATPATAVAGNTTWWIRSWNSSGFGPWSSSLSFLYGASVPGKVTLIDPSGGQATNTPAYSWNPVAGATWYRLWVNDESGTPLIQWYTSASVNCTGMAGVCSVTPNVPISGSANWWVQAWNTAGYGAWSDAKSFNIIDALTAPVTCGFANAGGSILVEWLAAANDGANRYVIERNRNSLGWYWLGAVTTGNPLQLIDAVAPGDRVQYRVKSRNAANDNSAYTTCIDQGIGNWQTTAVWEYEEPLASIKIIDAQDMANGYIGFLPTAIDDADVQRQNGVLTFNGNDNSLLIAPVTNSDQANPDGEIFRWIVEFSVPQSSIDLLLSQTSPSWNLMQRGFFNNSGGQWKTQLITSGNVVKAECIVRDGARYNGQGPYLFISAKSSNAVAIGANTVHTAICEYDDANNELAIIVDGLRHSVSTLNENQFPGASFGNVNPVGSTTCTGSNPLGGSITMGNKPACNTIDDNDRFVGDLYRAEIQK